MIPDMASSARAHSSAVSFRSLMAALAASGFLVSTAQSAQQVTTAWTGDLPAAVRTEVRAAEENYPNMYQRFGASLGMAALGNFNSEMSVGTDVLIGASLDLEDTLGLGESDFIGRFDSFYAFSPRHRIDFSLFDINRSGSRTVGKDFQFGEVVIPAGEVDTTFSTMVMKLAYRYNFVADVRTAIGFSAGFHTMGIDLGLDSTVGSVSESFDVTAPLPVIGLHGEYALSERWKILSSIEMFQIDIGYFSGYLQDSRLALEHDTFDHFGWGVSLNGFRMGADMEEGPLNAEVEYAYQGLIVYLRGYL
jgi:hypothetical protein